jgi:hypothetical protein
MGGPSSEHDLRTLCGVYFHFDLVPMVGTEQQCGGSNSFYIPINREGFGVSSESSSMSP